jgi:hypothetical protein
LSFFGARRKQQELDVVRAMIRKAPLQTELRCHLAKRQLCHCHVPRLGRGLMEQGRNRRYLESALSKFSRSDELRSLLTYGNFALCFAELVQTLTICNWYFQVRLFDIFTIHFESRTHNVARLHWTHALRRSCEYNIALF